MGSISERIHNCQKVIRNAGIHLHYIACRDAQIFGESSVTVHTHANGVLADVLASTTAVTAVAAGYMPLSSNAVTYLEILPHSASEFNDFTHILVANRHRGLNGVLRPLVPVVDVQVGAADCNFLDFDKNVVHAHFRHRNVFHPYARLGILLNECFHFIY